MAGLSDTSDKKAAEGAPRPGLAVGTDGRIRSSVELLGYAPFHASDVVLDIGVGSGEITVSLAARTSRVFGTGLELKSYPIDRKLLETENVEIVETAVEKLPFPDEYFDGAVMSHVLEHCPNVGVALREVRRVLKPNGLLCVLVPPAEPIVCGGHLSVGWNVGQLMYVLAVAGYDAASGHFIKKGYNVVGFVRKTGASLPKLRNDYGDLRALADAGRFPLPIVNDDPRTEAFYGDIEAVNWPWIEAFEPPSAPHLGWKGRLLRKILPEGLQARLSHLAYQFAGALAPRGRPDRPGLNPDALSMVPRSRRS